MTKKTMLLLLLVLFWQAMPAGALTEREVEFMRLHLDVQPAPGWTKVEAPALSAVADCVGYRGAGVALLACPIVGEKYFAEVLADEKKSKSWVKSGDCVINQGYEGLSVTIVSPLKKGRDGAFFMLSLSGPVDENFYKCLVEVSRNGVAMPAFDAKLLQKAEPMLRIFSDFAIPASLPVFHPVFITDKGLLAKIAERKRK